MMVSNRIPSFTWRNYEFNIYIIAPKQPEYDPKLDLTICKSVRKFGYANWDTISFKFSICPGNSNPPPDNWYNKYQRQKDSSIAESY